MNISCGLLDDYHLACRTALPDNDTFSPQLVLIWLRIDRGGTVIMRWKSACLAFALLFAMAAFSQQPPDAEPKPSNDNAPKGMITLPVGTQIPLKLSQAITTKNAKPGDPVYAETVFPITQNDRVIIPAGTFVQGRIGEVKRPGRVKGRAELLMNFTTLVYPSGYTVMMPAGVENMPGSEQQSVKDKEGTVQQAGSKAKDAQTIATAAGTGATIGAIADHSAKGAGLGALGGGVVGTAIALLSRGPELTLPVGTSVQMVLDRPLVLQESKLASK